MESTFSFVDIKNQINDVQRYVTNEAGSANLPGKENGPQDAYRHLLISAELTRRFDLAYDAHSPQTQVYTRMEIKND
jgi:hypothetical protein